VADAEDVEWADPEPEPVAADPLLDEVEVLVFFAGLDDPRSAAVKLIHHATGIEVESATEPTQVANRDRALRLLRASLAAEPGPDDWRLPD
jgi:hypothetical protein